MTEAPLTIADYTSEEQQRSHPACLCRLLGSSMLEVVRREVERTCGPDRLACDCTCATAVLTMSRIAGFRSDKTRVGQSIRVPRRVADNAYLTA